MKKRRKERKESIMCYLVELFTSKVIDNFWLIFKRDHRPGKQYWRCFTALFNFVKFL